MEADGFVYRLIVAILLCKYTCALDYSRHNLTAVPRPPAGSGPIYDLDLTDKYIEVLNDTSFISYDTLIKLYLLRNKLKYILAGTFMKMYQLKILYMDSNALRQLPIDFGPSDQTLKLFYAWNGVSDSSILVYPYFTAFVNLEKLNLGGSYNMEAIDA